VCDADIAVAFHAGHGMELNGRQLVDPC
jgi:hypothetical protein